MIVGQCTHKLLDITKKYINLETVSISYDPMLLINIIEKTVLSQTEDQYPLAILYDQ